MFKQRKNMSIVNKLFLFSRSIELQFMQYNTSIILNQIEKYFFFSESILIRFQSKNNNNHF
jgi:hypothetical protein